MAEISIIVPVYKVENLLRRCVESMLRQTFRDFEIILVDDGSPDTSGEICDAYAREDSRIHVIHQANAGVSAARNTGIEWILNNSDSRWVAFVDSDDWLHRDYLSVLLSAAKKWDAQIAMCGCIWTDKEQTDMPAESETAVVVGPEEALVSHHPKCTPPWGKLVAKSLLQDLRFPVGIRYEDAAVTHILTLSANRIAVSEQKLYYYYSNPDSFTKSKWTEARLEAFRVHDWRLDYFRENGYLRAYRKELELYLETLAQNLETLMYLLEDGEIYRRNFNEIRHKLQEMFRKAKEDGTVVWQREYLWVYIFAMPTNLPWKTAKIAKIIWHKVKK